MTQTAPAPLAPPGPPPAQWAEFRAVCEQATGRSLADPAGLHAFSVREAPLFWRTLLDWTGLPWSGTAETVLVGDDVETARFFPGVAAELRREPAAPAARRGRRRPALTRCTPTGPPGSLSRA